MELYAPPGSSIIHVTVGLSKPPAALSPVLDGVAAVFHVDPHLREASSEGWVLFRRSTAMRPIEKMNNMCIDLVHSLLARSHCTTTGPTVGIGPASSTPSFAANSSSSKASTHHDQKICTKH